MKPQPPFRMSGWVTGSLLGLVAVNFLLVLFVAGVDLFLGQPPQFLVPLVVLLIASASLLLSCSPAAEREADETAKVAAKTLPRSRWHPANAPAYIAMTIIRRPPAQAQAMGDDRWKGVV
jgi:hypothetical protein